jgi:signal transduction histidine kinase
VVLWRALAAVRVVLLGYAVVVYALNSDLYARAGAGWCVLAVLGLWTVAAPLLYAAPAHRPALVVVESALACGALLLTPWVQGSAAGEALAEAPSGQLRALADAPSVPSFWIAGAVLAGLGEAALEFAIRPDPSRTMVANIFLLVVAGLIVGYVSTLVRTSTRERAEAAAARAAAAERDRLSRAVHDGVLQALSYIQRRGAEIGGEAAELAELAAGQEAALRALVSGRGAAGAGGAGAQVRDVAAMLHLQAGRSVSVATPGEPVPLPANAATELVAAVAAALDNTARHAAGATAYVLLEDEGDGVVVSVGDDGPGIPAGRLDEAVAAGRMGVAQSIMSRLADIGGTAKLTSAPGAGTEWELRVPRPGSGLTARGAS